MQSFYFRKFNSGDKHEFHNAIKGKEIVRHMASEGFTLADCEWIINDANESWEKNGFGSWAVIDQKTDKLIGWAGFKLWKKDEVELLCVLKPDCWGIGKEIFLELVEIAFNKNKFSEIYILLPVSRKTFHFIRRMGFRDCGEELFKEETFKKFVLVKEEYDYS